MESEQASIVPGLGSSSPAVTEAPGDPASLAQLYVSGTMAEQASINSKGYNLGGQ